MYIAKLNLDSYVKGARIGTLNGRDSGRHGDGCFSAARTSGEADNFRTEHGGEDQVVTSRVFRLEANTARSGGISVEAEACLRGLGDLAV